MERVEVGIDAGLSVEALPGVIESGLASFGLQLKMRGTLRKYPGSLHWHAAKPGERGTLELTLWPAQQRLWFSVQAGRRAAWIEAVLPQLKAHLEQRVPAPQN
jgi:hypothetical protein